MKKRSLIVTRQSVTIIDCRCSRSPSRDVVTRLDLNHNISPVIHGYDFNSLPRWTFDRASCRQGTQHSIVRACYSNGSQRCVGRSDFCVHIYKSMFASADFCLHPPT